jgi:hypothetical protein
MGSLDHRNIPDRLAARLQNGETADKVFTDLTDSVEQLIARMRREAMAVGFREAREYQKFFSAHKQSASPFARARLAEMLSEFFVKFAVRVFSNRSRDTVTEILKDLIPEISDGEILSILKRNAQLNPKCKPIVEQVTARQHEIQPPAAAR